MTVEVGRAAESRGSGSSAESSDPASDDDRIVQPAVDDTRSRWRRLAAPLAATAAAVGGLAYLAAVDPNQPGHYPQCPTQSLFGIDCPGCGIMRGTHDLITGDAGGALDHNVALVVLVPLTLLLWLGWLRRSWTGRTPAVTARQSRRRTSLLVTGLIVLLAFGVVRNFVPYLGSGIG